MTTSTQAAQAVVELLKTKGHDYSKVEQEIAELFDDYLWNGNWDMSTDFFDLKNLRFIQEDEYDQSMDEDEKPDWDDQLGFVAGHYVFWN